MSTDKWNELVNEAKTVQQTYYELLPDWSVYLEDHRNYLKQNIAYAICGPPNDISITANEDFDITDIAYTDETSNKVINSVYEKVCEHGTNSDKEIWCTIIYNIIFSTKNKIKPDETMRGVPIFKVAKAHEKTRISWFVDTNGRVYENWEDYKINNTLPECTMVFPKDGYYQANPNYNISETQSTVWVEVENSAAATFGRKFVKVTDIASSVIGVGTAVGLGVTALVTPLGPIAAGIGLVTSVATGGWAIGRNSHTLVDRSKHQESISIKDKDACSAWLGIAGASVGVATVGGAAALSKVVQQGATVSKTVQVAFNTVVAADLSINAVGVGREAYILYQKYTQHGSLSTLDILSFTTHVLFFGNAVINVKFAREIISSSQRNVIEDFKANLTKKRHRKSFNKVTRTAVANNTGEIAQNAEVIRYIRKAKTRMELLSNSANFTSASRKDLKFSFKGNKIQVNDITLIDPQVYISRLIKELAAIDNINDENIDNLGFTHRPSTETNAFNIENVSISRNNGDSTRSYDTLKDTLTELLGDLYTSDDCPITHNLPSVTEFDSLLRELEDMEDPCDILIKLFKIGVVLLKRADGKLDKFLDKVICLLWNYSKACLKGYGMRIRSYATSISACKLLKKIITAIYIAIEMIVTNLLSAFVGYICENFAQNVELA